MLLQACPSCDRQYDVTHLEIGRRVHCVCDATFHVARPKEMRVRTSRCSHCGGRVEPGDVACSYCGAALAEEDLASTLCPRCFKRIGEGAKHCAGCGVEIAPQALTALEAGRACPRCAGALGVRALGATSVVECAACEGIWVTAEAFEAICRRAQDRPAIGLPGAGRPVPAGTLEDKVQYIPCLTCGQLMLRRNFRYRDAPSRVIVDYCHHHGVWLDRDELERIVAFIRRGAGGGLRPVAREPRSFEGGTIGEGGTSGRGGSMGDGTPPASAPERESSSRGLGWDVAEALVDLFSALDWFRP